VSYPLNRQEFSCNQLEICGLVIASNNQLHDLAGRSVVIPVENDHYARHNAVNHRPNADKSDDGGKHRKGTRRNKPSRKQREATKEGNPTSSTQLPRIVARRSVHGNEDSQSALCCHQARPAARPRACVPVRVACVLVSRKFWATYRRDHLAAHDQLIRPGTRSIADSGAVRHDLRSKINRATTSSAHAINHIKSSRSA